MTDYAKLKAALHQAAEDAHGYVTGRCYGTEFRQASDAIDELRAELIAARCDIGYLINVAETTTARIPADVLQRHEHWVDRLAIRKQKDHQ